MKRFLTKYGIMVLAVSATVAVMLSLITFFSSNTDLLTDAANTIAAPFRSASAAVAGWIGDRQRYADEFDALREENEALKLEIARMEEELRQAEKDSEENRTLRRLLELREQRRDLQWESARIVERDADNWASAVKLNIGTDYGVSVGDCVITEAGYLVGLITEAGGSWCTCTTVIDTGTSIGARVFRTGEAGVAQGDFTLMAGGRLALNYLPADANLLVGDLVVTSGLGGYYPADLVIGYVQELKTDDDGLAQYAVLQPAAQLDELQQVFVVVDFTIVE